MNTDVHLFCGASEISWLRLTAAFIVLQETERATMAFIGDEKLQALDMMFNLWRYHCSIVEPYDGPGPGADFILPGILGVMDQFSSYGCSDPRDRIFALYNMDSEIQPTKIKHQRSAQYWEYFDNFKKEIYMDIDYGRDTRETYQAFAVAQVRRSGPYDMLYHALIRPHPSLSDHWPTWVPDWRVTPSDRLVQIPLSTHASAYFDDSATLAVSLERSKWDITPFPEIEEVFGAVHSAHACLTTLQSLRRRIASNLIAVMLRALEEACSRRRWSPHYSEDVSFKNEDIWILRRYLDKPDERGSGEAVKALQGFLASFKRNMHGRCFYLASVKQASDTKHVGVSCFGFASTGIQPGDMLAGTKIQSGDLLAGTTHGPTYFESGASSLVIRPHGHDAIDANATFRLVGTAYRSPSFQGQEILFQDDWKPECLPCDSTVVIKLV